MLNVIQINKKKIIPFRPLHRATDETLKLPDKFGRFYIRILPDHCSSALSAQADEMVITTACVQIGSCLLDMNCCPSACGANVISWYAIVNMKMFARNVFHNKMTYLQ